MPHYFRFISGSSHKYIFYEPSWTLSFPFYFYSVVYNFLFMQISIKFYLFIYFKINFIEVYLLYNIVLVSAVSKGNQL